MGANSSSQRYGYNNYGSPPAGYQQYGAFYPPAPTPFGTSRKSLRRRGTAPQYYGYQNGMMPMPMAPGYPAPAMYPQPMATPQLVFPLFAQPTQQIGGINLTPPSAQVPQSQPQPQLQPQPQPQPQHSFSSDSTTAPMSMPEPGIPGGSVLPPGPLAGGRTSEGPVIPIMPSPRPNGHMPEPMVSSSSDDPSQANANPLPEPPREMDVPPHLLSGSAMTHHTMRMPAHAHAHAEPLANPLPEPPKDVYDSKRYRELTLGSAYRHGDAGKVYPKDWFGGEGPGPSLGRSLSKLNPFRPSREHRRHGHRRHNTMPMPMPMSGAPAYGPQPELSYESGSESGESAAGGAHRPFYKRMPFAFGRNPGPAQGPPSGFMAMPQAPGGGGGPQPMHSFSPSQPQGPPPPPIRFDRNSPEYGGFSHTSPHRILYKKKLYPTAAHLFEAHKFIGTRNDLAERVRLAEGMADLHDTVADLQGNVRRDWEQVLLDKMEDVLYLKFIQHSELRNLLLDTGAADLLYAEASDRFWGEGPGGEGANELGRALMRVRERLRREAAGR